MKNDKNHQNKLAYKEFIMNHSTEEYTEYANGFYDVNDYEAVNPKRLVTSKKTQQVHNTNFKCQTIKWHLE